MGKYHDVKGAMMDNRGYLRLEVDGKQYSFLLTEISERLAGASPDEQRIFQVSPSGYGIHWPLIDEDISIDGLLGVRHEQRVKEYA